MTRATRSKPRPSIIVPVAPIVLAIAAFSWALLAAPSEARAAEVRKPVEAGRKAFGSGRFPWYDSQRDALQPIELRQSSARNWEPPSLAWLRWVAWVLLAVILAVLAYWLALAARDGRFRVPRIPKAEEDPRLAADRVESLPFMAERPRGDLLGLARRHYEQGNFSEAIIYLFSYELVQLDRFAVVHLAVGKTNRQYLREAERVQPLRGVLERTMVAFESVFFGRHALDREGFEACWNQLAAFENLLSKTTP